MRVPRRAPAARPAKRDRARPSGGRGAGARGPAVRNVRNRTARPDRATDPGPPRRRTVFTGRAAVLALVVCSLALSLAYPIQRYVHQRQQLAELRDEVAGRSKRVQALEEQLKRWQDPAYVKQEARRRLHYVMPGEIGYVVIGPDGTPLDRGTAGGSATSSLLEDPGAPRAWYERLWGSVEAAARAPVEDGTGPARTPAAHIGPGTADSGTAGSGTADSATADSGTAGSGGSGSSEAGTGR